MKETIKDKRTTFRMNGTEYEHLVHEAANCGMDLSAYIRTRVAGGITRVFYDPSMVEELRAYREVIRSLAKDVNLIRHKIDVNNYIQTEDIDQVRSLLKSIYHRMEDIEQSVDLYRKELESGNNKIA